MGEDEPFGGENGPEIGTDSAQRRSEKAQRCPSCLEMGKSNSGADGTLHPLDDTKLGPEGADREHSLIAVLVEITAKRLGRPSAASGRAGDAHSVSTAIPCFPVHRRENLQEALRYCLQSARLETPNRNQYRPG